MLVALRTRLPQEESLVVVAETSEVTAEALETEKSWEIKHSDGKREREREMTQMRGKRHTDTW